MLSAEILQEFVTSRSWSPIVNNDGLVTSETLPQVRVSKQGSDLRETRNSESLAEGAENGS
jgi:hypothetical protein